MSVAPGLILASPSLQSSLVADSLAPAVVFAEDIVLVEP